MRAKLGVGAVLLAGGLAAAGPAFGQDDGATAQKEPGEAESALQPHLQLRAGGLESPRLIEAAGFVAAELGARYALADRLDVSASWRSLVTGDWRLAYLFGGWDNAVLGAVHVRPLAKLELSASAGPAYVMHSDFGADEGVNLTDSSFAYGGSAVYAFGDESDVGIGLGYTRWHPDVETFALVFSIPY